MGVELPNLMLDWSTAAVAAVLLFVLGQSAQLVRAPGHGPALVARRWGPFVRESGVVLALYALWQLVGGLSLGHINEAAGRGRWLWHAERAWHLPSEAWVQRGIVHHPLLVQACNLYYATMHFGVLITMLVWLFVRHRSAYARARTTIVLTTAACLVVGLLPVAPPRLIHVGMLDTATTYGQSVYTAVGAIGADQYSAMPSVHVAWAVLVAIVVLRVSRSRWRWLGVAHAVATVYVVTATANHYWADGIIATCLVALSLALQAVWPRLVAFVRGANVRVTALPDASPEIAADEADSRLVRDHAG